MMSGAEDAQSQALVPHVGTEHPHDLRMECQSGSSEGSVINGASGQPLVVFPDAESSGQNVAVGQAPHFFLNRPEFHWHQHVEGAVDHAARQIIAQLGQDAFVFSNDTVGRVHALEFAHRKAHENVRAIQDAHNGLQERVHKMHEEWRPDFEHAMKSFRKKISDDVQDIINKKLTATFTEICRF